VKDDYYNQQSSSMNNVMTALSRKTSGMELHCLVIRPDSSVGHGGHAKMGAQVRAKRYVTTTEVKQ
jgi:hypothetical protein